MRAWGRRSFEHFSCREVHGWLLWCALSQVVDDGRGKRPAEAGHGHDVRHVRTAKAFDRTEVAQQRLLAARPETGYAVQLGGRHRLRAALPVEGDRKTVRLVAQALQQVEALARAGQDDGVLLSWEPHLLQPLGETDEGDLLDAELVEHGLRGVDLGQSPVDDDEARWVCESLGAPGLRVDRAGGRGPVVVPVPTGRAVDRRSRR